MTAVAHPPAGRGTTLTVLGLAALLAALGVLHLFVGTASIAPADVVDALLGRGEGTPHRIVVDLRAPRTLIAVVAGAMLGLAGAILQATTRNDLAEPGLLGVTAGGVLAVVAATTATSGQLPRTLLPVVALGGSALAAATVYAVGWRRRVASPLTLILSGVLLGAVLAAVTSLLLLGAGEPLGGVMRWLVGSLHARTWADWHLLWPAAVLVLPAGLASARVAGLLALADPVPHALGLDVARARLVLFGLAAATTGAAVAVVGAIGFVGLVGPHMARRLVGDDARRLFPVAMLASALVLVTADVIATGLTIRVPMGGVSQRAALPVGAVTAVVGAPVLLALLRRSSR